jgi:hypothetical protein
VIEVVGKEALSEDAIQSISQALGEASPKLQLR